MFLAPEQILPRRCACSAINSITWLCNGDYHAYLTGSAVHADLTAPAMKALHCNVSAAFQPNCDAVRD